MIIKNAHMVELADTLDLSSSSEMSGSSSLPMCTEHSWLYQFQTSSQMLANWGVVFVLDDFSYFHNNEK